MQLVEAHSRTAKLDGCLRAVASEVSRSALITSDLRHATLPLLLNIETRLSQVLKDSSTVKVS